MNAIPYPATLPNPVSAPFKRNVRNAFSEARGYGRERLRDQVGSADVVWVIPFEQIAIWNDWYMVALDRGQLKAAIPLPGAGGILAWVCQFTTPVKREPGAGVYRMSATVQVTRIAS